MNDILRQWLLHTGFYLFGVATGATLMVYAYAQPNAAKPVVIEQVQNQDQRVKEMRFALAKLERRKAVHDATLKQAVIADQDIKAMVERMGK